MNKILIFLRFRISFNFHRPKKRPKPPKRLSLASKASHPPKGWAKANSLFQMREKLRLKLRRKKILKSGSRADVTKKKGNKKTTRDKRPKIKKDPSKKRGSNVNLKSPLASAMKILGKARKFAVPKKE